MDHRWCNMSSSNKKISQFIESSRHRCSAARQSNSDGISPLPYKIMKTKRPCKMSCQVDDFDSIQCESIAQKNMKRNMTMKKTANHFSLAHCCCFKRWNKLLHLVYFLLPTAATRRAIDNCFFSFFTPHSKLSHDFFLFSSSSSSYSVQLLESRDWQTTRRKSHHGREKHFWRFCWKVRQRRLSWMKMGKD